MLTKSNLATQLETLNGKCPRIAGDAGKNETVNSICGHSGTDLFHQTDSRRREGWYPAFANPHCYRQLNEVSGGPQGQSGGHGS